MSKSSPIFVSRRAAVGADAMLYRGSWLTLALTLALASLSPPVLVAAGWAPQARPLYVVGVLAVLAGAVAGKRRQGRRAALVLVLVGGCGAVVLALAGVLRPPAAAWAGGTLHWLIRGGSAGEPPLALALPTVDAARAYVEQGWWWYTGQGAPAFGQQLLLLLSGALTWVPVSFLAWALAADANPILGLMPLGAALVMTAVLRGVGGAEVLLYLLLSLLLLAVARARALGQRWRGHGGVAATARAQTLACGVALTALAGLLATALPAAPGNAVSTAFWQASSGLWARLSAHANVGLAAAERTIGGNVGAGLNLGGVLTPAADRIVMYVSTDQSPPAPDGRQINGAISAPMQYFVGATYASYTGRGWDAAVADAYSRTGVPISASGAPVYLGAAGPSGTATARAAGQPLTTAPMAGERVVQQVQKLDPTPSLLYALNTPLQANRPTTETAAGGYPATIELPGATSYTVVSVVPTPTADALRASGSAYPAWLMPYLKQPPIPARVAKLADQWTANAATPYDKVAAIEEQLRKLPYTTAISAPPPGRDPVDYFLFTLQRGYCEYFASAMVVMLRDVGVPARIATGYAASTYDPTRQAYVVTQNDAHTWVQVYFPNAGWIDFEPTPANPANLPPETPAPTPAVQAPTLPPHSLPAALPVPGLPTVPALSVLLTPLAAALAAIGALLGSRRAWERRLPPVALLRVLYGRLVRGGRLLGLRQARGETALEYGARLAARLAPADPGGAHAANELTTLYARARYSPSVGAAERAQALAAWRLLRRALWRTVLLPHRRAGTDAARSS